MNIISLTRRATRTTKTREKIRLKIPEMIFMLILTILLVVTKISTSQAPFHLDFETVIGDTFEDCIVTLSEKDVKKCKSKSRFRRIDGTCNDLKKRIEGAALTKVARFIPAAYAREETIPQGFPVFSIYSTLKADTSKHINIPFGNHLFTKSVFPSAQEISDQLFQIANREQFNPARVAHIFMTFGQFLDHDLVIIENEPTKQCFNPTCSTFDDFKYPCNPILKSTSENLGCNKFARSRAACESKPSECKANKKKSKASKKGRKTSKKVPKASKKTAREQVNQVTSFIDGSQIYGSSGAQLARVRGEDGELKTTNGDLLPFDLENERPCQEIKGCFLAGDIRVNENIALTSMHTVFLRLHNYYARKLRSNNNWNSDRIFLESRRIVIGIFQNIVYNEFLPKITDISPYRKYSSKVDASIANSFSAAAYRFGHSLVRNSFDQLDRDFNIARNQVPLQNAFNNIKPLLDNGIEETIFGLLANDSQTVDVTFSQGIAEKLFIPPGSRGFQNLAAINVQRGRDHGLPSYTEFRKFCKIDTKSPRSFQAFSAEIHSTQRNALESLFTNVKSHIDLYAAGIAEKPVLGKLVGPTFGCIIKNQFERLRDGDRFYFEKSFNKKELPEIKKMTLAKVLCLTLKGIVSIQKNAFERFIPGVTQRNACDVGQMLDITLWNERR